MAQFDDKGRHVPDPAPTPIPARFARGISRHEEMKQYIRTQLSMMAEQQGEETFEEADDFDVDEDPEILFSEYELREGAVEWPGGVKDVDADPPRVATNDSVPPSATTPQTPSAKPPSEAPSGS